ncbi:MAG: GreA/GreB family elongation factor [Spirochaetota bacterium]
MDKIIERLDSLLKEESFGRLDAASIGISRFKVLEDYTNDAIGSDTLDTIIETAEAHHAENPGSVSAKYILGVIACHMNDIEGKKHLVDLMKKFYDLHKWAVVVHLAEKLLEYGENSVALKYLAESLEKLKRRKEAIPVWENLIKTNRYDAETAYKLSQTVADEDRDKSVLYLKLALEGFIKNNNTDGIDKIWRMVVERSWEDTLYFERIERMLVEIQQKDIAASILLALYEKYKDEDVDKRLQLLKSALEYNPKDIETRKKLIRLYQTKYRDHSQLKRFLNLSRLNNFDVPVSSAIKSFEGNIVFDTGNYVYHRNWGVGVISEMDEDNIIIDFADKKGHRMSVNMALQSLVPLSGDHLYVRQYESQEEAQKLFEEDTTEFLKLLVRSHDNSVTTTEIKRDVIPSFIEQKSWSRWWTKARNMIKKDPSLGFSPNKKDVVIYREKPMSYAEELAKKFASAASFGDRLNIAEEFVTSVDVDEGKEYISYLTDYYQEELKGKSNTKIVLSYFILRDLMPYSDSGEINIKQAERNVHEYIKNSDDLALVSMKISSYDNKKEFINLIRELRSDWLEIAGEILFETPVRIHKYIFNLMIMEKAYRNINEFIEKAIAGAKQYPEVFLWIARNVLQKNWDYEWLDYSHKRLVLTLFRMYNDLNKTEVQGNRLKNQAYDLIFENDMNFLRELVQEYDLRFLTKIYDMIRENRHVDESEVNKFAAVIRERYEDFAPSGDEKSLDDVFDDEEEIIVTKENYDRKAKELNQMVNSEMVRLQKELAKTSDVSGDLRENVDYNALLEKQAVLKKSISNLDAELKHAKILKSDDISTDEVSVGTRVHLTVNGGETLQIVLLGPWDTDYENMILSYRSEVGRTLLKKKKGDCVNLRIGGQEQEYTIENIEKYL